ncbi:MAG: hypothetical protein PVI89_14960 [Desulfobacteraceae bacterium]|jgi:hypothetical protein
MGTQSRWRNHFQEHKVLFTLIAVGLFLVELEIFAMASVHSRRQSFVQVLDQQNNVIYEVKSAKLLPREKTVFEKTFGPLSNYRVNVVTKDRPFPFRPWFAAAVGLPVGAVLLFGFLFKAYETLFFRKETAVHRHEAEPPNGEPRHRMEHLIHRISRLNIFVLGSLVLMFALGLWAVPHLLTEFGRQSAAIIGRYKWVALSIAAIFLGLVIWIIFLRYLLARRAIEAQAEVEKYRLQLELMGGHPAQPQLPGPEPTRLSPPRRNISETTRSDKERFPASS